jgi:anaerobic magnesium-protoporphyrin IX monomethyl ester cyclase
MKVLLINPSQKKVYGKPMPLADPPLGILHIGAVLEMMGHECALIDIDADNCYGDRFCAEVKRFGPDIIGITATTAVINSAFETAGLCKGIFPNVPVIAGGIHPTIRPAETLENNSVDFVVIGEGEATIAALADAIEGGGNNFSLIDGIGFKKDGETVITKRRGLIEDIDSIPFPARHLLRNPQMYVAPDSVLPPTTAIMTSRGCFGKCTYCQSKYIFGTNTRFRSVKNVIGEIEECIKKYGIREFHICDDNFAQNKKRTLEICNAIKNLKTKLAFSSFNGVRADSVDEEILGELKSIGFVNIGFGVESGNQRILERIKKGVKLDTIRSAFKMSKKAGLQVWGFFIIGLPGETKDTVRDTINFAKELDPDFAKFLILKPYPGSEVFDELTRDDLIFDHNYDYYGVYTRPVHRLPELTEHEMLFLQRKANREFYFRPRKIIQHFKRIKSITQLKYNLKSALFIFHKSK